MRRALCALSAASLLLAGCAYLLDSPFPAYVPLMVEQADVSAAMPYEPEAFYRLQVISLPAGDFLWLFGEGPAFGERFALFDPNLSLVLQVSETPGQDIFRADSALIPWPIGARLIIGKRLYDPSFAEVGAVDWEWGLGFYDETDGRFNFPYLTGADDINWDLWSGPNTPIGPVASGSISGGRYSYYGGFEALYHDAAGGRVALYARPYYDNLASAPVGNILHGIVAPAANFRNALVNPLLNDTRAFTITTASSDFERPYFAGEGTVIRYYDDDRLVFYDLSGRERSSMWVRGWGDTAFAFSPSGRHWYVYAPETGRLAKARTWW